MHSKERRFACQGYGAPCVGEVGIVSIADFRLLSDLALGSKSCRRDVLPLFIIVAVVDHLLLGAPFPFFLAISRLPGRALPILIFY